METDSHATSAGPLTTIVAALVAVVFLAMSVWLTYSFKEWEKVAVVYNAVCAVAFSAFGVLLGSKVQEVNVARAVHTAEKATADVQKKNEAIKTAARVLGGTSADNEAGGGTGDSLRANRMALDILMNAIT